MDTATSPWRGAETKGGPGPASEFKIKSKLMDIKIDVEINADDADSANLKTPSGFIFFSQPKFGNVLRKGEKVLQNRHTCDEQKHLFVVFVSQNRRTYKN